MWYPSFQKQSAAPSGGKKNLLCRFNLLSIRDIHGCSPAHCWATSRLAPRGQRFLRQLGPLRFIYKVVVVWNKHRMWFHRLWFHLLHMKEVQASVDSKKWTCMRNSRQRLRPKTTIRIFVLTVFVLTFIISKSLSVSLSLSLCRSCLTVSQNLSVSI